jgi:ATP-dependent Clp protease adaptor protein ClpS
MPADRNETRFEEGLGLETRKETKRPSLYRVVLLNDDYTTMEFVVAVLENIFDKSATEATQIMLHVHKKGSGLCGVYTKDIAETKVDKVHKLAREKGFPLKCVMERE